MGKARTAVAAVGILLIAFALVLAFLITPKLIARLPGDTDKHRDYTGTFQTLLDPAALAAGNLIGAVKSGVPMTVAQEVKVSKTSGNTALVSDTRTTSAAGTQVEKTSWSYAVDRRSLEATTSHPSDWNVVAAKGLTVSWPFGAEKKTYQGWTPETRTAVPVNYLREESRQGVDTYVYEAKVAGAKIVDDQILAGLPKGLPLSALKAVAAAGLVPAAEAKQFEALLPTLPDPAPLSYALQDDSTFWIEPTTGVVVDVQRSQQRVAELTLPNGLGTAPLLPAVAATYQETPASSASAAKDAKDGRRSINILGTILPIILGVLGALMVAGAFLLRRRGSQGPAGPAVSEDAPGQPQP
jgi:hypothetical protein